MYRGGRLIRSRVVSPAVIASRCSQTRSICQFGRNGVVGSSTGQACSTNARNERAACRVRSSSWSSAH